jgi:beta-N-acetylhexosaminidase
MAAEAGMDLIMCAVLKPGQGEQARVALAGAYRSGALNHPGFQAAVQRILALKAGLRH